MGNSPLGWVAPPYKTSVSAISTGALGGILGAAFAFSSNPAAVCKAIYQLTAPLNNVQSLHFAACTFAVVGGGSNPAFQVSFITAAFNSADGQPEPAGTAPAALVTNLTWPAGGPPPFQTFVMESAGYVGVCYGVKIIPVEAGAGFLLAAGAPPAPFLRWPLLLAWGT